PPDGASSPAAGAPPVLLDQHRVAELVRAIPGRVERRTYSRQRRVVEKGAQQLIVAAALFVRAREDRVDRAQPAERAEPLIRDAWPRRDDAGAARGVLQRPHDRSADGDDAAASR